MMLARDAFDFCVKNLSIKTVLDVGCGKGYHADAFKEAGKTVTSVDITGEYEGSIAADFMLYETDQKFDLVWASHILEHQLNVNAFLKKCRSLTKEDGYIAVTVPPAKSQIVGGHVSIWNAGLLMYNLILAGYDCSSCHIKKYDYNISVIASAGTFLLPGLVYDRGDIETISHKLPFPYNHHGFNGDIEQFNWQ
jgi:SAM-dependent methyltransferase